LISDPLNLFSANIFYPYANTLAFSEIMLPQALLMLPLRLATDNPIFAYNTVMLGMLWLNAMAMYLLAYDWTRRAEAGWIAGMVYGLSAYNLGNLAQLQLVSLGWLPLALLFLSRVLAGARGRWAYAFLFAVSFIFQSLASFYYAVLAGLAVGLYVLWAVWVARRKLEDTARNSIPPLAFAVALIAVVLIPFLSPYFQVQRELGFQRRIEDAEPFSASLEQFVQVSPTNVVYGGLLAPDPVVRIGGYPLDVLFPGILALGLAGAGFAAGPRRKVKWFLLAVGLVAFVLALGPRLYLAHGAPTDIVLPYRILYELLPPLRALRAPVRFDALITFALAGLSGLGAAALSARIPPRWSGPMALALVVLVGVEQLAVPAARTVPVPTGGAVPEVYRWLNWQAAGVALELPMMGPSAQGELDISTQYFTTYHWHKTPDGYSGFVPPRRGEVAYEMAGWPSARALALMQALDVRYLIDHGADGACVGRISELPRQVIAVDKQFGETCVYQLIQSLPAVVDLDLQLFVPESLAAGAPFRAFLIVVNRSPSPTAVKPTDEARLAISWDGGREIDTAVKLPLVTSSVSVIPVDLVAPEQIGERMLSVRGDSGLLAGLTAHAQARVGSERVPEMVLPAQVELREEPAPVATRGEGFGVRVRWKPRNKIDAYYSASVRLVGSEGKVANEDRQPSVPTLLWRPETPIDDEFVMQIPAETAPGRYRIELLMYQGDTREAALLLDEQMTPARVVILGTVEVR
jgi:hypothetical protein